MPPLQSMSQNSSEEGTSMLEFAFSAIVVFTLLFGCIGLAMALYTYEVVNEYARDASRYAMVHGNGCVAATTGSSCSIVTTCTGSGTSYSCSSANTALKTYLNNQIYPGINGANLSLATAYTHAPGLTSCFGTHCNASGDQVTVTVTYGPYLYKIPFIPQQSFTMHASSTMIISQ